MGLLEKAGKGVLLWQIHKFVELSIWKEAGTAGPILAVNISSLNVWSSILSGSQYNLG